MPLRTCGDKQYTKVLDVLKRQHKVNGCVAMSGHKTSPLSLIDPYTLSPSGPQNHFHQVVYSGYVTDAVDRLFPDEPSLKETKHIPHPLFR